MQDIFHTIKIIEYLIFKDGKKKINIVYFYIYNTYFMVGIIVLIGRD